jgi:hypothetical protein
MKGARFIKKFTEYQPKPQPNPKTKGADNMNQSTGIKKAPSEDKRYFTRRIGSTTFRVAVHFNPDSKETAGDKISRLIRMEADSGKAVNS